jgi:hypothetical protein
LVSNILNKFAADILHYPISGSTCELLPTVIAEKNMAKTAVNIFCTDTPSLSTNSEPI